FQVHPDDHVEYGVDHGARVDRLGKELGIEVGAVAEPYAIDDRIEDKGQEDRRIGNDKRHRPRVFRTLQVAAPGAPSWHHKGARGQRLGNFENLGSVHDPASQVCAMGYLARIVPIRFSAFSAAACGVIPSLITSASAVPQICWASASA